MTAKTTAPKVLALALLISAHLATGLAPAAFAQAPAPFDMTPERSQDSRPPVAAPQAVPPAARPPASGSPAPRPPVAQPAPTTVSPVAPTAPPAPAEIPAPAAPNAPPAPPTARSAPTSPQVTPPQERPVASEDPTRRYLVPAAAMRLSGEVETRAWSVYLTPEEAGSTASLNIGYQNAIVVAPEASQLTLTINDIPIYQDQISSPDNVNDRRLQVPPGTLKAGMNLVRFRADQRHRTDCTVESTYELWTDINPERTYLSFEDPEATRFTRLDDIRAVGVDLQGKTRFRLIVPSLDQLGATDLLMRLVQGLSLMGGMPNQSFSFEKTPGAVPGPGELAIFVGTPEELRPMLPSLTPGAANAAVASFVDYPGSAGASALVLSGPSWPSLENLIDSFVASTDGTSLERRETLSTHAWQGVDTPLLFGEGTLDFSQLGVESQEFGGRLFRTRFTIGVPADFYANAYGEARILLDAAYVADVQPGSHLDIIVNGSLASTVPITSSGGAVLEHLPIKLTLQHFRPGVNTIDIEAALITEQDSVCAPGSTADNKPRFALFGTSQFEMPDFARIAQVPNIAATAGVGFPYGISSEPVSLFLGRIDEQTFSAAATFLGKVALASHRIIPVNVTISAARVAGKNALFVGSISEFPANILTQLKIDQDSRSNWSNAAAGPGISSGASLSISDWQTRSGDNFVSRQTKAFSDWIKRNFNLSLASLRFAPAGDELFKLPPSADLLLAQESDPTQLGTWTAILAPDSETLKTGMETLSTRQSWDALKGRIMVYDSNDEDKLSDVPVSWFRFMPTQTLSFSNARLIAANWLSDNIMSYALLLASCGLLLGLATGGLLSQLGRK